ncbi:MAG: c-type cytochrome [Rhizomicrobium sp.]
MGDIIPVILKKREKPMDDALTRIMVAILFSVAFVSGAAAQEQGNSKKGSALAASVCAQCHAVRNGEFRSPNPMAPSFSSVAAWPGMTDRALRVWLQTSHPSMPNIMLTGDERNDIAAYIMTLKPAGSAM